MNRLMLFLLLAAAPLTAQERDPLDRHIADLGDDRATVRETALQALLAAGPPAIPRLRRALESQDAEVRQRASSILGELERDEKLADVMQARTPVTLSLEGATFAQALEEVSRRTGLKFEGVVTLPDRAVTASFTRAPVMQVLDGLAAAVGDLQWSFEGDSTVFWRRSPPVLRPSCYAGGFKISLSRLDVYKSWDYQQGHGLMWV